MLCFFKGIELSTPINSSVLITVTPILVFVFSRILIKEKFMAKRIWGVILGFVGAVVLIVFGNEVRQDAPNIPLGNFLFIINASAFAIYLIIVKPLSKKYTTVHLLKWLFLFGFIMALPITYKEFDKVVWENLPLNALWRFAYVVIGTTFLTYLLNVFALKYLKATSVSVFTYLQPLIGISYAIIVGADSLSLVKISAAVGILFGVYLVTKNYEKN